MAVVDRSVCDHRERVEEVWWRSTRVRRTGRTSRWSTPTCTSHRARSGRCCPTCPRGGATTSARAGSRASSPTSTRRGRRSPRSPAPGPPTGRPARPRAPARPAARPVAAAPRHHALHLRRRRHPQPRRGRRHGPRGQRLAVRRVARQGAAAAGVDRRPGPDPAWRRRRSTASATTRASSRCSCRCARARRCGTGVLADLAAAERHGLALALHFGGAPGNPADAGRLAHATTSRSTSTWRRSSRRSS